MAPALKWAIWAIWALAVSHAMGEEAAELVKWEDLMVAASRFPRFFGSPALIPRNDTDPPKVTALSTNNWEHNATMAPFGTIQPMNCSSDSGNFSCVLDCNCVDQPDVDLEAYSALQEGRSSLSHHLDGLNLTADFDLWERYSGDNHTLHQIFFTQTLGGRTPIDNTQVKLGLNENANGSSFWLAPEKEHTHYQVYNGEFNDSSTQPTCNKFFARDTAAQAALNQPFWYALNPDHMKAEVVYTVQDGRLFLTWRLRFNLQEEVGDDFYVWINARNCSEVVAAASAGMDPYVSDLAGFKKELTRLFKEERGIDLDPGQQRPW